MGCGSSTVAVEAAQSDKVAVLVTVEIKPEMEAEFLEIMHADALESRKEEGCECFHLLKVAGDEESTYSFYEVYKNVEAQKVHKTLPHYLAWADFKQRGGVVNQTVVKHGGVNVA